MADYGTRVINFQAVLGEFYEASRVAANATPATAGTWIYTIGGQTATGLAFDITASAMQTALEALSNVAPGDVTVTMLSGADLGDASAVMEIVWRGAFDNTDPTTSANFGGLTGNVHVLTERIRQVIRIPSNRGSTHTIKAARVYVAGATALDTATVGARLSAGITDGTTQRAQSAFAEDNVVASAADTGYYVDTASVICVQSTADGSLIAKAVHHSFGTGIWTIDWTIKPVASYRCSARLWYGADLEVFVTSVAGNATSGNTVTFNPGFSGEPTFMEFHSVAFAYSADGGGGEALFSVGYCDDVLNQGAAQVCAEDRQSNTSVGVLTETGRVAISIASTAGTVARFAGLEVTAATGSLVTLTTRDFSASVSTMVLAVRIPGIDSYVVATTIDSSATGTEAISGLGFVPHTFGIVSQQAGAVGTLGNTQGQISIGDWDEFSSSCVGWFDRDNQTTSASRSVASNTSVVHVLNTATPEDWVAEFSSRANDTVTINVTDASAAARVLLLWALEETYVGTSANDVAAPDITASGSLTISGTSLSNDVAAPDITASGTVVSFVGTSALNVAAPDITAAGTETISGASALLVAAPDVTAAGDTVSAVTGTSALNVAAPALASAGAETFTGTSALLAAAPDITAAGAETFTGTSALLVAAPALASSGVVVTIAGSAALLVAAPDLTSAGTETISGASALLVAAPDLTAAGMIVTVTGSAALLVAAPALAASGAETFSGTAALLVAAPDITAAGTVVSAGVAGSANLLVAAPVLASSGTLTISGTSALQVLAPALAAAGMVLNPITGTSALNVAAPDVTAAGTETFTGTSVLLVAAPALATAGAETIAGTSSLLVAAPDITASGTLTIAGSAALNVAAPDLTATGALTDAVTGTALLQVAGPALSSLGLVTISGSGALAVAAPSLAATDAALIFDLAELEAGVRITFDLDAGTRTVYDLEAGF